MTPALAESLLDLDFPEEDAIRIRELNGRANEGQLTDDEEAELEALHQYRRSAGLLAVEGAAGDSTAHMTEYGDAVRRRACGRCEYCRLPQSAFRRPFHIEHIVARQHGGSSSLHNLALACWSCSLKKGPNLSGVDPKTGDVTALVHPRKDDWEAHFSALISAWRKGTPLR